MSASRILGWITFSLMLLLTTYEILIFYFGVGDDVVTPRPKGFELFWIVTLAKLPAIVFSRRHHSLAVIAGLLGRVITITVFQMGESDPQTPRQRLCFFAVISVRALASKRSVTSIAIKDVGRRGKLTISKSSETDHPPAATPAFAVTS